MLERKSKIQSRYKCLALFFAFIICFVLGEKAYASENEIKLEVGNIVTIDLEYGGGNVYCTYTDSSIANASITGTSIVNDGRVRYYKSITIEGTKVGSTAITFYDSYGALDTYIITVNAKTLTYDGHVNSVQTIEFDSIGEDSFYTVDDCCTVTSQLISTSTSTVTVNGYSTTTVKYKYNLNVSYTKSYEGLINILSANKGIIYAINANISDHVWNDEYMIVDEATCTNKGIEAITCSICNEVKEGTTRELEMVPHIWNDDYTVIKPSTCIEEGIKEYECINCGEKKQEKIDISEEHDWDEGKITKEPTLKESGIKKYTCKLCGTTKDEELEIIKGYGVIYTTHVQSIGWQKEVKNGALAGTVGMSKRLEAIKIQLDNAPYEGDIEYRTHVQSYGWLGWVKNGAVSGTSGEAKRLESIQIRLTGKMADYFDVFYRVQAQTYGWLGWAKNGQYAGTAGYAKRLEAIQVVIVPKGTNVNGNTKIDNITLDELGNITYTTKQTQGTAYIAKTPDVYYRTHVQSYGWQGFVSNGEMSGTSGKAKRLEGIEIKLGNLPYEGGIRYTTHVQTYGWQGIENDPTTWRKDGIMAGTTGEAKRLEAIRIELYGELANKYDVYYRVHSQTYGWLGWACNGEPAGTAGFSKRLEGIQIVLVEDGKLWPDRTYKGITTNFDSPYLEYGMIAPTMGVGGGGGSFYRQSDNIEIPELPKINIGGDW